MSALAPALAVAALFAAPAQGQTDAPPGELLVRFAPSADAADRAALRERARRRARQHAAGSRASAGQRRPRPVLALAPNARSSERMTCVYAEPNFYRRAFAEPGRHRFATQWGLRNTGQTNGVAGADINALAAWDITTGSATRWSPWSTAEYSSTTPTWPDRAGPTPARAARRANSNGLDDDRQRIRRRRARLGLGGSTIPSPTMTTGTAPTWPAPSARGPTTTWAWPGRTGHTRLMALRAINASGSGTVADVVKRLWLRGRQRRADRQPQPRVGVLLADRADRHGVPSQRPLRGGGG